jgi:cobalt-zinc-cadmium efflux system membrane fusion protein
MAAAQANPTILVVDDDESIRQTLAKVLGREGLTVVTAGSVAEARSLVEGRRLDLGLLDLSLPDGDGVELAESLHARLPGLPLILMTAYPLRLRGRPELSERFVSILTKPVELPELRQALQTALQRSPAPVSHAATAAPDFVSMTAPMAVPVPRPSTTGLGRGGSWMSTVVVFLALAVLAGGAVVMSGVRLPWQTDEVEPTQQAPPPLDVKLVEDKDRPHTLAVPEDVRTALGIRKSGKDVLAQVVIPTLSRPLELPGSTQLDPTQVQRVRIRFTPAEIVKVGRIDQGVQSPMARIEPRELQSGDTVTPKDVLAEVYSPDIGNKKNDLFEAIVQLRLDEVILERAEKYSGSLPEFFLWTAQRNVETDRSAMRRAQLTLMTWDIPQEDVDDVIREAREVRLSEGNKRPKEDDAVVAERQKRWARVLLRPRFSGVIIDRNAGEKEVVTDNTQIIFVVAKVHRLFITVIAPEDMLPELDKLKGKWRRWNIRTAGAPTDRGIDAPIDDIGYLVDPNVHGLVLKGHIDNPGDLLRGGQYVTATIQLPAPDNAVEVPVAAVVDDGKQSVVFVREDPKKPDQFTMRRVQVTHRFDRSVFVRSKAFAKNEERTPEEAAEGLQPRRPLHEGDSVLIAGALELKKELEDREAAAEAARK